MILILITDMNQSHTELYEILGLKSDASEAAIKNAYKLMARKYHPDKNKEPGAEEMFKKINQANAVLSDPEKKRIYDQFGLEGFEAGMGDGMDPMSDIINMMRAQQMNRRPMQQINYELSLKDYFTKKSVTVKYQRNLKCEACDATGFTDKVPHKCKKCNGVGVILQRIQQGPMIQQVQMACPQCKGQKFDTNASSNLKCKSCNCQGTTTVNENLEVKIPTNILDRRACQVIENEKGHWVDGKYIDLLVGFTLKPSKEFSLTSNHKLAHIMHINYTETICGFRRIIDHPSGKKILIISEKGNIINPDNLYVLDGIGLNNDAMYLTLVINYPEKITLPKNAKLSFESLEMACGERKVANAPYDIDIDPENVFTLSVLTKINNSRHNSNATDSDDDDEGFQQEFHQGMPGMPGVNVQQCAQQ